MSASGFLGPGQVYNAKDLIFHMNILLVLRCWFIRAGQIKARVEVFKANAEVHSIHLLLQQFLGVLN